MKNPEFAAKWQRYREAGCKALDDGQPVKAEGLLSIALKQAEQFGRTDIRLAVSLQDMAEYYATKGDYRPAEALYKRSLTIKKKVAGDDHPDVEKTYKRWHQVKSQVPIG